MSKGVNCWMKRNTNPESLNLSVDIVAGTVLSTVGRLGTSLTLYPLDARSTLSSCDSPKCHQTFISWGPNHTQLKTTVLD